VITVYIGIVFEIVGLNIIEEHIAQVECREDKMDEFFF
jgi:hypothetical protein